MKAKLTLENGQTAEIWIADWDVEMLEKEAKMIAQIMGDDPEERNAATELIKAIPWHIKEIRDTGRYPRPESKRYRDALDRLAASLVDKQTKIAHCQTARRE